MEQYSSLRTDNSMNKSESVKRLIDTDTNFSIELDESYLTVTGCLEAKMLYTHQAQIFRTM